MLKRRLFLSAMAAGATSAMMPAAVLAAIPEKSLSKHFATLVGSEFQFKDTVGTHSRARLVAFDEGPSSPGLEQFSVVFKGDGLAEGLYDIHHPGTGKLKVFCMPSTDGAQRAHFSHFS